MYENIEQKNEHNLTTQNNCDYDSLHGKELGESESGRSASYACTRSTNASDPVACPAALSGCSSFARSLKACLQAATFAPCRKQRPTNGRAYPSPRGLQSGACRQPRRRGAHAERPKCACKMGRRSRHGNAERIVQRGCCPGEAGVLRARRAATHARDEARHNQLHGRWQTPTNSSHVPPQGPPARPTPSVELIPSPGARRF